MVEARRVNGFRRRGEGFAEGADEMEEFMRVKGECCAAAGEGVCWVWQGGELCAGEVVAVHGEGRGDWSFGRRVFGGVELIDAVGHCAG